MTKTKYQVYDEATGKWETCVKADPVTWRGAGWLHYQLRDGTNGLARPGTWRKKITTPTTAA